MFGHRGGTRVKAGFYFNVARWNLVVVPKGGGVLAGTDKDRYARVPALVLLGLAPVMGGLYVMFLPFIGFAMVAAAAGTKALDLVRKTAATEREIAEDKTKVRE